MGTQTTQKHTKRLSTSASLFAAAALISFTSLFASHSAFAKTGTPAADQKPEQIVIPALLDTTLDSKKQSSGGQVEAKTVADLKLSDGTDIPKGTTVIGHITDAKAKGKGDAVSTLTIQFDKLTLKDGKTVNIEGHLRAVGPNPHAGDQGDGVDYGTSMNKPIYHGQSSGGSETMPLLNNDSNGVEGIKNLGLDENGMLRTGDKAVKLGHNTQMLIAAKVVGQ
ncbi:MAG TPA: hypothetical protein VMD76_02990 [Candidatus Sulfotelmatobacter sp.]|nr:hypothetical protein [Candidatus Sulfotelmatobacter sp.]